MHTDTQIAMFPQGHGLVPADPADEPLLALSLWRPWPAFFFPGMLQPFHVAPSARWGPKWLENRPCKPSSRIFGKRVALHAAQKYDHESAEWLRLHGFTVPGDAESPTGIVGLVTITGWVQVGRAGDDRPFTERERGVDPFAWSGTTPERARDAARSPWCFGPFAWVCDQPVKLPEAVPCRGQQMLGWDVPPDVARRVRELAAMAAA